MPLASKQGLIVMKLDISSILVNVFSTQHLSFIEIFFIFYNSGKCMVRTSDERLGYGFYDFFFFFLTHTYTFSKTVQCLFWFSILWFFFARNNIFAFVVYCLLHAAITTMSLVQDTLCVLLTYYAATPSPQLFLINFILYLQQTPKDKKASLVIHGRVDKVLLIWIKIVLLTPFLRHIMEFKSQDV